MSLMRRRLKFGVVAGVLTLAIGGLALADELDPFADNGDDNGDDVLVQENDDGPPWLRFDVDGWLPGDGKPPWAGGPPPWAGDSDGSGDEGGDGAPWLDPEFEIDWRPGDGKPPWVGGPTPWSNAAEHAGHGPAWFDDEEAEWTPGDGKPPWAGGPNRAGNGNSNGNGNGED